VKAGFPFAVVLLVPLVSYSAVHCLSFCRALFVIPQRIVCHSATHCLSFRNAAEESAVVFAVAVVVAFVRSFAHLPRRSVILSEARSAKSKDLRLHLQLPGFLSFRSAAEESAVAVAFLSQ
jgi:hypothetical protein